jgi:hypothetical protein
MRWEDNYADHVRITQRITVSNIVIAVEVAIPGTVSLTYQAKLWSVT